MAQPMTSRGHLNPGPDATVSRHAPPADVRNAVVHFWVPEWNLPPGQTSRQIVLSYPVLNLVIQPGAPEGNAALYGPRTTVSFASCRATAGHSARCCGRGDARDARCGRRRRVKRACAGRLVRDARRA